MPLNDNISGESGAWRRTVAISDIHGCREELERLLDLVGYCPGDDRLLLLGDYVSKGPDSKGTVELVMRLAAEPNVAVLKGNHDQRFVELFEGRAGELEKPFFQHGGEAVLISYLGVKSGASFDRDQFRRALEEIRGRYAGHLDFLRGGLLYVEDNRHIYVHAGLDPSYADWRQQPERNFYTIREPFHSRPVTAGRTVVFGHTPVNKLHGRYDIWFQPDKIGIDGGCSAGGRLNALICVPGEPYRQFWVPSLGR